MTWEYLAGFIDGEGTIVKRKRVYNLCISQTNFEVLNKIRKFAKVGSVYVIGRRKAHWKEAWVYSSGGGRGAYHILSNIIGHLIVKRKLALRVLGELKIRLEAIDQERSLKAQRTQKARLLRRKGWSYRKIAKELMTDFGYVRRLVLSRD